MLTPIHTIVNEIADLLTGKISMDNPARVEEFKMANKKIQEFYDSKYISKYFKIDVQTYMLRVESLLFEPQILNQGSYGICGATANLFAIIKYRPSAFANFAIQLYKEGKGNIGDNLIVPGTNFYTYDFVDIVNKLIAEGNNNNNPTDLILIGAVEDATNTFADFDVDDQNDLFTGQIFTSTSKSFFEKTDLFGNVFIENPSVNIVPRINNLLTDHFILLDINTKPESFFEPGFLFTPGVGKHMCVMEGTPIELEDPTIAIEDQDDNTKIIVRVFTWGGYKKITTTKGDFYSAVKKIVAVKVEK